MSLRRWAEVNGPDKDPRDLGSKFAGKKSAKSAKKDHDAPVHQEIERIKKSSFDTVKGMDLSNTAKKFDADKKVSAETKAHAHRQAAEHLRKDAEREDFTPSARARSAKVAEHHEAKATEWDEAKHPRGEGGKFT